MLPYEITLIVAGSILFLMIGHELPQYINKKKKRRPLTLSVLEKLKRERPLTSVESYELERQKNIDSHRKNILSNIPHNSYESKSATKTTSRTKRNITIDESKNTHHSGGRKTRSHRDKDN